eukprot:2609723-Karenia_brevis.AAC.1
MVDENGKEHTERQSIANVFAAFYEQVYATQHMQHYTNSSDATIHPHEQISPFTYKELDRETHRLKNKRSPDNA